MLAANAYMVRQAAGSEAAIAQTDCANILKEGLRQACQLADRNLLSMFGWPNQWRQCICQQAQDRATANLRAACFLYQSAAVQGLICKATLDLQ